MTDSALIALRRCLQGRTVCATCGGRPEVSTEENPFVDNEWRIIFRCHGKLDWAVLPARFRPGMFEGLIALFSIAFHRSVARHGQLGQAGRLMRAVCHGARRR